MTFDNVGGVANERSVFDHRLIRTAVVGARDSTEPVFLPQDCAGATAVLHRHRGRVFYCGLLLGGCGWPLRIWRSRRDTKVAHFAHRPNGPRCSRYDYHDADADHLYIYNGLVFLARRHTGHQWGASRNDISFRDSRCDSVLIRSERSAVRVQFADLAEEVWRFENGELRRSFENIQWIFGPGAGGAAKALRARDGYVLRARCELRGGTREVLVRMETTHSESPWIPLEQCYITEDGIVMAAEMLDYYPADQRKRMSAALDDVEAASPRPEPDTRSDALPSIVSALTDAMERNDFQSAAALRDRHLPTLAQLSKPYPSGEIHAYRAFMRWYLNHPVYQRNLAAAKAARRAEKKRLSRREAQPQPTPPANTHSTNKTKRRRPAANPPLDHFERSVDTALRRVARQQQTITLADIPGARFEDRAEMVRVLLAIERASPETDVLLTALIVGDDRKCDGIFRRVLTGLGYECPSTDFAVQLAWRAELERTHARHAITARPLPARVLHRRSRRR